MRLIECTYEQHGATVRDILNDAILNSTAIYDYSPRSDEDIANWFAEKRSKGFPVIGAVDETGRLLGFATYGTFRARPGYKYTVENSVYVHQDFRGRGTGRRLLNALIQKAIEQDYHLIVAVIDATNTASIRLHESFGFTHAGTIREAGFKFDRWLDLAIYQLILPTPGNASNG